MRKSLILILIVVLLVSCNRGSGEETNPEIDEDTTTETNQDSPRAEALPTATFLPPTWTPVPVEHSGHLQESPGSPSAVGTRVEYIVQRGDTLAEICNRYGVSIAEVAKINNISNWDRIETGQVLTLPISGN